MTPSDGGNNAKEIIRYHEESKHHYDRYARSAEHMDWDNHPNPFRFYEDTQSYGLPFLKKDPDALYADLYRRDNHPARGITLATIAGFLELSLGLSAWKAAGESRWPLRMNPSSGNLHPTEAHLILPRIDGLAGGVYHYNPLRHALEQRAIVSETTSAKRFGPILEVRGLSHRFKQHILARILEIRGTRLSLLQPRCRSRPGRHQFFSQFIRLESFLFKRALRSGYADRPGF